MSSESWVYDQRIVSDPKECAPIIRALLDELADRNWPDKDSFGIHMAMEEAIMNAIKHGNEGDSDKFVHVSIRLSANFFKANVTDEGNGFDLAKVPSPIAKENLDKCSGRGVMLIKHFVDEAEYNEEGNSVCLKKTRSKSN